MMLTADGFDDAIVGIGRRCGQPDLAVYSIQKAVEILIKRDRMTWFEAYEYLEFNCVGAWVGDGTPMWVDEECSPLTLDE